MQMKLNSLTTTIPAAAVVAFLASPFAAPTDAAIAYGLTSTGLLQFDTGTPSSISNTAVFSGLTGGDNIVDIDYRPQDGTLYGIAQTGRLYRINPLTGAAVVDTLGAMGTVERMDFNPMANRLRVLSAGDQNYRITPGTGLLTSDGVFTFAAGDPNAAANPTLSGAAYTNSFVGAGTTTLYTIDSGLDILVMNTVGPEFRTLTTVGALGLNVGTAVGFDIVGTGNDAYVSNGQSLYNINLATGALTSIGTIGGAGGVIGLAVVPEPGAAGLAAVGALALLKRRRR